MPGRAATHKRVHLFGVETALGYRYQVRPLDDMDLVLYDGKYKGAVAWLESNGYAQVDGSPTAWALAPKKRTRPAAPTPRQAAAVLLDRAIEQVLATDYKLAQELLGSRFTQLKATSMRQAAVKLLGKRRGLIHRVARQYLDRFDSPQDEES